MLYLISGTYIRADAATIWSVKCFTYDLSAFVGQACQVMNNKVDYTHACLLILFDLINWYWLLTYHPFCDVHALNDYKNWIYANSAYRIFSIYLFRINTSICFIY